MKFLLTLILSVFVLASHADIGLSNRSAEEDATGTLKSGSLEKFEIKVANRSGGALVDGDVVVWDPANDDGYSVTTSTTAGAFPACVLSQACADDEVCLCQTYGYKSNVNFDVTNVASTLGYQAFISENNAGYIQAETLAAQAASDRVVGMFYDTNSSSGDVELFIKLR